MPALTGVSSHQSHDPAPDGETQQSDGKRPPSLSEVECGLPCPRTLVLEGDDSSLVEGLARRPVPHPPELVFQAVCRVTSYQYLLEHRDLKCSIKQDWPWSSCLHPFTARSTGMHHQPGLTLTFSNKNPHQTYQFLPICSRTQRC